MNAKALICAFSCVLLAALTLLVPRGPLQYAALGNQKYTQKIHSRLAAGYGTLGPGFEENRGQADSRVKFLYRRSNSTLFFTADAVTMALRDATETAGGSINRQETTRRESVLRMKFLAASPSAKVSGLEKLAGNSNYFVGDDPANWQTNVPNFAKIKYHDLYPGIDLVYYSNGPQLEYDLLVAPGAASEAIKFTFEGADDVRVDAQGDLIVGVGTANVRLQKPLVYQNVNSRRHALRGAYVVDAANQIRFQLDAYDKSTPLVIDPLLVYSSYLGGKGPDKANAIAVDTAGSAYVVGPAGSIDFPTTVGSFQTTCNGSSCGGSFITKFNSAGTALVYSTYISGRSFSGNATTAFGIAVDAIGNAYVTGSAGPDFPVTANAFQTKALGLTAFAAKLNPSGDQLVYSTFLGPGSAMAIAVDAFGSAYVTGQTGSTTFPTVNPIQAKYAGAPTGVSGDAFISKLDPTGSSLTYSTYLGGSAVDTGFGIAVDASGAAFVTGNTSSADFPVTTGAFQTTLRGFSDAFVVKVNPQGSAFVYSTLLGGAQSSTNAFYGGAIAIDAVGNAYVVGATSAIDFPVTDGAFQTAYGDSSTLGGRLDVAAFITKLNSAGTALVYSTFLGAGGFLTSGQNMATGVAVDASGDAYVAGITTSTHFPIEAPVQVRYGGGFTDAFVTELNPSGSALVFSTYLGGSGLENPFVGSSTTSQSGPGIALDPAGNAYIAGGTNSTDFPTVNPIQSSLASTTLTIKPSNVFVAKLSNSPPVNPAPTAQTITPDRVFVGSSPFSLSIAGSNFVSRSVVRWNGAGRATSFNGTGQDGESSSDSIRSGALSQLSASIPASDVATVGTAEITVFTPGPGGGASNSLTFTIDSNPIPVLDGISPIGAGVGGPAFTLTARGSQFLPTSVIRWNGSDRTTSFDQFRSTLTASIPASDLAAIGVATVEVFNPAPGGGASNALTFLINPPPVVNPGGIVPAATFSGPLVAGSIASIFGTNLSLSTAASAPQ